MDRARRDARPRARTRSAGVDRAGARSTRAGSPSGLDGPGWESITTPRDLGVIYRAALTYPVIALRLNVSVSSVKKYMAKATEHCLLFSLEHG